MDSSPQSSGICQRLFRFILGGLRLLPPAASNQVVVEDGPPPSRFSPEVMVEFRHSTDQVRDDHHQAMHQDGVDKKRKGVKKSVTIMENERKKEAPHHHNHSADLVPVVDDQLQDDSRSRRHWPLLSVASNINEKSEEFIEKKKKAMSRNYSLDQEHKK